MNDLTSQLIHLTERAEREKRARKEAEFLLEAKSLELYEINQALQKAHDELESRVQERTLELEVALLRAEEASRAKSDFLANMSHEIRTPLTAILGFSELLRANDQSRAACEIKSHAIDTIRRNGEHLLKLINELLDLAKIEARKLSIEPKPCSVVAIVHDVCTQMQLRADERGLQFSRELSEKIPPKVITDPTRLRQILLNLIGNAIKFTERGTVNLSVCYEDRVPQELIFDIADTGIGLTAKQQSQLFQPFVQADNSLTRIFGGTGLGLSISKSLAERLNGSLEILTSTPGRGTTFRLTIKTEGVRQAEDSQACSPEFVTGELTAPNSMDTYNHAPPEITPPSKQLVGCKVLLAEDMPDNQKLISFLLNRAGADVTMAENGVEAIAAALASVDNRQPFDVILMDMQMPKLDGYQASSQLRSRGYRHPIVALTAHAMQGDREKCLAAGCDAYATKPIDSNSLISMIANFAELAKTDACG